MSVILKMWRIKENFISDIDKYKKKLYYSIFITFYL